MENPVDTLDTVDNLDTSDTFQEIVELFCELRGQGISLSHDDLLTLAEWENLGFPPSKLKGFLLEIAYDKEVHGKAFPKSLNSLHKHIVRKFSHDR
jgi:hypothetical protein